MRLPLLCSLALGAAGPAAGAQGACWAQRALLEAVPARLFGESLALSGDTLLIGNDKTGAGAAVFVRGSGGWVFQQELLPSTPLKSGFYGIRVALDGDVAAIGEGDDGEGGTSTGAVFVFHRSAGVWQEAQKLRASDAAPGDLFGWSLAVDGDRIAVGAFEGDQVYVFERLAAGWVETHRIPSPRANIYFGATLSLSGPRLLAGGPRSNVPGLPDYEAYVYAFDGAAWELEQTLASPLGPTVADDFGASLDLDGDRLVIGAPALDFSEPDVSAAYVYARGTGGWTLEATLLPDPLVPSVARFASSVALDGERLAIGVPDVGLRARVQVHSRSGGAWSEEARLAPDPAHPPAFFARSVDVEGGTIAVGDSNAATAAGSLGGRAFVFEHDPTLAATVGYRNAGINPVSYAASPARVGEGLRLTVLPATTGHTHALVIGFDSPASVRLGAGPTLLCLDLGGNGELLNTGFRPGPLAVIDVVVPFDLALIGARVSTQAVHAGGAQGFALSNAQDLVIGPPSAACP